jgi:hypothetical protein
VRTGRHPHAAQRRFTVAFGAVGDRAGDQVLAFEIVGIERAGGVGVLIQLVDRHPLLLAELLVQIAPVGGEVGTVVVARDHAQVTHLQHVSRLGVLDIDRAGHDMDAGVAVVLGNFGEDPGDRLVHHQVGRVAGMVGDRLGAD